MQILVIEDNSIIRANIIDILQLEGHKVLSGEHGAEGLMIAKEHLPDLIFCDLMMPIMDGLEFLQHVRQDTELADSPIIFVTAKTEKENVEKGMEMGANGYILKPFSISDILSAIEPYQSS